MDIVYISDLRVDTVIGIYDWERTIRQVVSIDLEMGTDIAFAASTDAIEDTLNYKSVAKRVISFVQASEFELVEKLAEAIARIIITEFNVPWLSLKLGKPGAVRGSAEVGVMIERTRADYLQRGYISIGSNQNPKQNILAALQALTTQFGELELSTAYQNPSVGFEGSDFINLVVGFDTSLSVPEIGKTLRSIEESLGRDRSQPKFSSRCIDLDLLILDNGIHQAHGIELPRDEILKYAFVLCPLVELVGNELVHPTENRTYADLWQAMSQQPQALTPVLLS